MGKTQDIQGYVVAIGASAGGLEAIHDFFDHMPETGNAAFVIIQHLSPDYKSLLVELVGRHTHMQVSEAADDLSIENNCIYIIPNNKFITIRKNRLYLEDKRAGKVPNTAVDHFLLSLAKDRKNRAIALILSGTGTDGTKGIEAIKQRGGHVLVQDPATARFDGMPNSAIGSGNVDAVLAPADMPVEILQYLQRAPLQDLKDGSIDDKTLEEVFSLIHQEAGFDFHYYKTPTIQRRIIRRAMQGNHLSLADYVGSLRHNPEEIRLLGKDFLIGVTRFFRDAEAFDTLRQKVLPNLLVRKNEDDLIKIWVCACSTGEEAYSIAILMMEVMEEKGVDIDFKIYATDPDGTHIDMASRGVYPMTIAEDVSEYLLKKYFTPVGKTFVVSTALRKHIVFARHNVIKDPPFIKNDLVTCRNMLIYMSPILQQKIFALLLFAAKRHGYLFLGSSEHATFPKEAVIEVSGKWKMYQKIIETRPGLYPIATMPDRKAPRKIGTVGGVFSETGTRGQQQLWEDAEAALEEEWGMAAFYIDQSFDIKEAVGNYRSFLALPERDLHLNLLKMVPRGLAYVLATEVRKAWTDLRTINLRNIPYAREEEHLTIDIIIRPAPPGRGQPFTMVLLREQKLPERPETDPAPPVLLPKEGLEDYIRTLDAELQETRRNLQLAIEDLETANEELQSSNEELLSANEELQSSNEELQSLNEELHTLNTEHQLKIGELIEANDDLNNYFRSTDIGQVFLDKDLRIRKFNPASARMINFIDSDLGRSITHISNNIRYEHLNTDIDAVMREGRITEKEVRLYDDKDVLMRIMPYLTRDREIGGVVLTFVDITTITQLNNIVRGVFNSSPSAILALRSIRDAGNNITDLSVLAANDAASTLLSAPGMDYTGSRVRQDLPLLASHGLFELYTTVIQLNRKMHVDLFLEEQEKWFEVTAVKMMDGLVATFTDITEKKFVEQKLKKNYVELINVKENLRKLNTELEDKVRERTRELGLSEERFRLVARATNDALWDWDFVNNKVWWGDAFSKLFGYSQNVDRAFWLSKIHPNDRRATEDALSDVINSRKTQWSCEYRFLREDGQYAHILDRGQVLHNEYGTPYRMLGSMLDLTDLKKAEQAIRDMNEALEQKVALRTKELGDLNHDLEQSNHDLQQFASVASHDLQEPLRKILIFSNVLKDKYGPSLAEGGIGYLDKILHSAHRTKSLVTDILNYSRLSSQGFRFEQTSLTEVLSDILDDFELAIRDKQAQVQLDPLPEADVIPGQIRQVFQNIISNALKFTTEGVPSVIRISGQRVAAKSFDAPVDAQGPYVLVRIRDNGIGFDEKFSTAIFNLFQRLNSKDRYEGTGIGLAIAKKIVERHDGLIMAHSREGEGAEFMILLPLRQQR
jgi:two-component system CheB/CheR fusion protein